MSRVITAIAGVASLCLAASCAHPEHHRRMGATRGSVRLDRQIREVCGDRSADAYFDVDSTSLTSHDVARLDVLAACFSNGPMRDRSLNLVGYTDPTGTKDYNKELGMERAEHIAHYLERKGVPASHLHASSRGEEGASRDPKDWPGDRMVDVTLVP